MPSEMNSEAWFKKGAALNDNSPEELYCYHQAIHLNPGYALAYYASALTRFIQGAVEESRADLQQTRYLLNQLEMKADKVKIYFAMGHIALQKTNYQDAIAWFGEAIQLQPDYAYAYLNRGVAHKSIGSIGLAIADYNEAIRLDPTDCAAFFNRANCHLANHNLPLAIRDFSRALDLKIPETHLAYANRGQAYLKIGDLAQAIRDCTKAIEINPDFVPALNNRGIAYGNQHRYDEAIADFRAVLRLQPNNEIARNSLEIVLDVRHKNQSFFSRWFAWLYN